MTRFFMKDKSSHLSRHTLSHGVGDLLHLKFPLSFRALRAFKYRDRVSIMNDILRSIRSSSEGRKKTQIMQSANLNFIQTKKYLNYMLNCGFLVVTERETYALTEKGSKLLLMIEMQKIQSLG